MFYSLWRSKDCREAICPRGLQGRMVYSVLRHTHRYSGGFEFPRQREILLNRIGRCEEQAQMEPGGIGSGNSVWDGQVVKQAWKVD